MIADTVSFLVPTVKGAIERRTTEGAVSFVGGVSGVGAGVDGYLCILVVLVLMVLLVLLLLLLCARSFFIGFYGWRTCEGGRTPLHIQYSGFCSRCWWHSNPGPSRARERPQRKQIINHLPTVKPPRHLATRGRCCTGAKKRHAGNPSALT